MATYLTYMYSHGFTFISLVLGRYVLTASTGRWTLLYSNTVRVSSTLLGNDKGNYSLMSHILES